MSQGELVSTMPSANASAVSQLAAAGDSGDVVGSAKGSKSGCRNGDHEEARAKWSESGGVSDGISPSRHRVCHAVCERTSQPAAARDKDHAVDAEDGNSGRQTADYSNSGLQNDYYSNSARQNGDHREGRAKRMGSGGVSDINSPPRRQACFVVREDNEAPFNCLESLQNGDGGFIGPGIAENSPGMMALPASQQIPPPLNYPMVCLQKEMSTIAKTCLDSLLRYTEECVDRGEPLGEVRARAIETVRENPPLDMVDAMVFMETVDVFERLPAVRVEEMMFHFGGPQNRATLDENQLLLKAIAHVL